MSCCLVTTFDVFKELIGLWTSSSISSRVVHILIGVLTEFGGRCLGTPPWRLLFSSNLLSTDLLVGVSKSKLVQLRWKSSISFRANQILGRFSNNTRWLLFSSSLQYRKCITTAIKKWFNLSTMSWLGFPLKSNKSIALKEGKLFRNTLLPNKYGNGASK